jgi:hypothetical protein
MSPQPHDELDTAPIEAKDCVPAETPTLPPSGDSAGRLVSGSFDFPETIAGSPATTSSKAVPNLERFNRVVIGDRDHG